VLASLCAAVALFFFLKPGSIEILATAVAPNFSQNAETDKANTAQPELVSTTPQGNVDLQVVAVSDRNKPVENAFARGTEWLADSTAPSYSIQLAAIPNETSQRNALADEIKKIAPNSEHDSLQHTVMLFRCRPNSLCLLRGQFESREAALAAYQNLPATTRPRELQIRTKRGVLKGLNTTDSK
jgi:septal ring-binding cell division protein DamX